MPRSSNLRASSLSGNPYGRTNDVIEAASIGPKATLPQIAVLNHRISLEFSEAHNQPLSSSSGADDVAAPTLPSVPLSDDSVSSDISIPRSLPLQASSCLYPMMPTTLLFQVRKLHKAVLKESLWISMMDKAMMIFLPS
ncbi:hypothetical protein C351_05252 [Cryptococcus neoformans c8]|nr:hypothetical protein C351_05252 [Cryptococcus neoformans var. grubii c8]